MRLCYSFIIIQKDKKLITNYDLIMSLQLVPYSSSKLGILLNKSCVNELSIKNMTNVLIKKQIYGTNPPLGFYGHDERLGACFENPSIQESQNAYPQEVIFTIVTTFIYFHPFLPIFTHFYPFLPIFTILTHYHFGLVSRSYIMEVASTDESVRFCPI